MPERISDGGFENTRRVAQDILNAARAHIENRDRPQPSEQESLMNERMGVDPVRAAEIVVQTFDTQLGQLDAFLRAEGKIRLPSLLQRRAEGLQSNLGDDLEELIDTAVRMVKAAITGEVRQVLMEACRKFNHDVVRLYNDLKSPVPTNEEGTVSNRIDALERTMVSALYRLQKALNSFGDIAGVTPHSADVLGDLPRVLNRNEVQLLFRECGVLENTTEELLSKLTALSDMKKKLQRRGLGPRT
jgi:hypothetical protein